MATIALDFDNTYTADPGLWDAFIENAKARGHTIVCVTARRDTGENREIVRVPGCTTYFTGLASKLWFMRERRGLKIDIWIDDDPQTCVNGH